MLVTRMALAAEYPAVSREVPTIPRDCARVTPVEPAASTTAPFRIRRPGDFMMNTLHSTSCHVTEGYGGGHLGVAVVRLRGGLGLGLDSGADLAGHRAVLGI